MDAIQAICFGSEEAKAVQSIISQNTKDFFFTENLCTLCEADNLDISVVELNAKLKAAVQGKPTEQLIVIVAC